MSARVTKRDAEAERQDERGRQRARPMDVGEGEARSRRGARQPARQRHQADRHHPQEQEGARGADEHEGDLAVVGGEDREADEGHDGPREGRQVAGARPAPLGIDLVPEEPGDRHVVRAGEGASANSTVEGPVQRSATESSAGARVGAIGSGRRWPKSAFAPNGRAAPTASPSPMPRPAISITCTR